LDEGNLEMTEHNQSTVQRAAVSRAASSISRAADSEELMPLDTGVEEPLAVGRADSADSMLPGPRTALSFMPTTLPTPLSSTFSDTLSSSHSSSSSSLGEGSAEAESESEAQTRLMIELEKRGKSSPPEAQRRILVHEYHLRGHFGRDAVYKKLFADGYWWPKMRADIDEELRSCDACIRFVVTKSGYHPAQSITALLPGDHWQLDCSTHMPTSPEGYTAILHIIDVCTNFVVLRAMKQLTGEAIAKELLDIISLLGPPKIIQSDNGPEFVNDVMRAFTKLNRIGHRFILPYNPRADGKVERSVGVTTMVIKKFLHGCNESWPLFLPFAQMSYNDKISTLTGSSPYALMFGRRMNQLTDYSNSNSVTDRQSLSEDANLRHVSADEWKEHQMKVISLVFPAISDRVRFLQAQMKRTLNKHRRQLLGKSIPAGAVVMLRDPHRRDKFEPKYIGPYSVIRRAQNGGYVLRDATGDILDRHVPPDQIKIVSKQPLPNAEDVYVVRSILDHRGEPGSYEYLVDWKGYKERTWEPEEHFDDYDVIKHYWESKKPHRVTE
jgi:transposase InsO family protein